MAVMLVDLHTTSAACLESIRGESEGFAFLQGSQTQSRPWWKIHLFVWEPVLFGTWDGVFTSCMINIFGVVLFLRTGWLVVSEG